METSPPPSSLATEELAESEIFVCKFCGQPSELDPIDQCAPVDYCHPGDHQAI